MKIFFIGLNRKPPYNIRFSLSYDRFWTSNYTICPLAKTGI